MIKVYTKREKELMALKNSTYFGANRFPKIKEN